MNCFLPDNYFQRAQTAESVHVSNLKKGDVLSGPDGPVVVKEVSREHAMQRDIVRFQTEDATISVTSNHRICAYYQGIPVVRAAAEMLSGGGALYVGEGQGRPFRAWKQIESVGVFNVEFVDDESVYIVRPQRIAVAKGGPGDPWFGDALGFGYENAASGRRSISAPASILRGEGTVSGPVSANAFASHGPTQVRLKNRSKDDPPISVVLQRLATEAGCVSLLDNLQLVPSHAESVAILPTEIAAELKERISEHYKRWLKSQSTRPGRSTSLVWRCSSPTD